MDDDLKKLFDDFNPELSSGFRFMDRLQQKMESVEIVREHYAEQKRRNRKAVVIAAMTGFLVGLVFSMALPYLGSLVENILRSLLSESAFYHLAANYQIVVWLLITATSVFAAMSSYDISLAFMNRKDSGS